MGIPSRRSRSLLLLPLILSRSRPRRFWLWRRLLPTPRPVLRWSSLLWSTRSPSRCQRCPPPRWRASSPLLWPPLPAALIPPAASSHTPDPQTRPPSLTSPSPSPRRARSSRALTLPPCSPSTSMPPCLPLSPQTPWGALLLLRLPSIPRPSFPPSRPQLLSPPETTRLPSSSSSSTSSTLSSSSRDSSSSSSSSTSRKSTRQSSPSRKSSHAASPAASPAIAAAPPPSLLPHQPPPIQVPSQTRSQASFPPPALSPPRTRTLLPLTRGGARAP